MGSLKPATVAERVAGSPLVQGALTVAAALSGDPMLGAVPALMNSLAAERHAMRIKDAFREINVVLVSLSNRIEAMSDSQFKVACEAYDAIRTTTDAKKLEYLKRAIVNTLTLTDLRPHHAVHLARVLRDMSAQEARFVSNYFGFELIMVAAQDGSVDQRTLCVLPGSEDHEVVSGLISLGVLVPAGEVMDTLGKLRFSPLVAKLLTRLLQPLKGADSGAPIAAES